MAAGLLLEMLWITWGPKISSCFSCYSRLGVLSFTSPVTAGSTGAPRSLSSAFLVPVEKNGSDFHRLAMPTHPKSPIRSIPKYGSGVIPLGYFWLE